MATLKVWIDGAMCIGSANCVRVTGGAIALGDDGVAHVVDADATDDASLRLAERGCPTGAVFIEVDDER
jgi:ferredoxin